MNNIPVSNVRNFVLMGHSQSGKTTLADALLHKLGVSPAMGSVDDGSSLCDFNPEEKDRKQTIWCKPFSGVYKTAGGVETQITFVDAPGFVDFYGQVVAASRAADTGLIVVDAGSGVQVGTQRAWKRCDELGLPRGIVVTGLDKENASFLDAVSGIQDVYGSQCVPVLLPAADLGAEYSVLASTDIPEDLQDTVDSAKQAIVESAAETDDSLIEKYLSGEELTAEELAGGLHVAVNSGSLIPVFAVAAKQEFGVKELLEAICRYFPSPADRGAKDAEDNEIPVGEEQPFAGIVWKSVQDPYAGQLSFVRVVSGTVSADSEIANATNGGKEKVATLLRVNGDKQDPVDSARAGDVVAISKLKNVDVSDCLCAAGQNIRVAPIVFPQPVVFHAVVPKNKGDEDKLVTGLSRMADDDPTIQVDKNAQTGDLILAGMGDVQLDIAIQKMQKRQNIELELQTPRVAYRETITSMGEGKYRHKKQSGGRGQFGEVYLRVDPLPEGEEEWFVNKIVGGSIPSNFIPAVEKGLVEGKQVGSIAGYPVENVRITVYDGSYHDVDSSEVAFKIAASRALREASGNAKPVLLEPVMELKITVPGEFMGDITGDISHRRGRMMGMETDGAMQIITAEAPQAELFKYSSELRSMTGGRGSFEMKFIRYEQVPANITQQIVKSAEAEKEEAAAS